MPERCTVPPEGWQCSGAMGHDGPCAAWPSYCRKTAHTCDFPCCRCEHRRPLSKIARGVIGLLYATALFWGAVLVIILI